MVTVWGLGFEIWSLGFGLGGLGIEVWGLGSGVWGLGLRIEGVGLARAHEEPDLVLFYFKVPISIRADVSQPLFSSSLLSSLVLSDTNVNEPKIRALLGTASHFCEVVVLKLRTVPIGTALRLRESVG